MHFLATCFLLPFVSTVVIVQIHQSAIYNPGSTCTFLGNISLPNDASIQTCIWQCVQEDNCQTAVYYGDKRICSIFTKSCKLGGVQSSADVQASVICYRDREESFDTCSSTVIPIQTEHETTTSSSLMTSTEQTTTTTTTTIMAATTTTFTTTTAAYYGCSNFTVKINWNYPNNDISNFSPKTFSECCVWCLSNSACTTFSFTYTSSICWLKTSTGGAGNAAWDTISATR